MNTFQKKYRKYLLIAITAFCLSGITLFALVWNGIILLNGYKAANYDVKGIDVSAYQGEIDWKTLANNELSFVFIKATEGSSFVDQRFAYNFEEAKKTPLAVGAYHFFSYDSKGKTQAENFIKNVVPFEGMLPPVIDLEFYGGNEKNPPLRSDVEPELKAMLDLLTEHYKQKPIIYATEKSYELYLSGDYKEYDIWIRNVISSPKISDERSWTFWQYTNRGRLKGYNGKEKYIDINVFCEKKTDFTEYLKNYGYKTKN